VENSSWILPYHQKIPNLHMSGGLSFGKDRQNPVRSEAAGNKPRTRPKRQVFE
jgi:hypothetical protein